MRQRTLGLLAIWLFVAAIALSITSAILAAGLSGAVTGASGVGRLTLDQAQQAVQTALNRTGDADLAIDEIMEFENNFYAIVKEKSTGIGAFELLVQPQTGAVFPEYGPNMMWNTKYGMMGNGMMGQRAVSASANARMPVSAAQATQIAQRWLDQNQPGSTTEAPDTFYGYYTLHILKGGAITGMLSVNGSSGQVWYHTWHGAFIQMKQVGQ